MAAADSIDIAGLDREEVFIALYNSAKPLGLGKLHYRPGRATVHDAPALMKAHGYNGRFDYVQGRVMKVDLSGDVIDVRLYNRDNGANAAQDAITTSLNSPPCSQVECIVLRDVIVKTTHLVIMLKTPEHKILSLKWQPLLVYDEWTHQSASESNDSGETEAIYTRNSYDDRYSQPPVSPCRRRRFVYDETQLADYISNTRLANPARTVNDVLNLLLLPQHACVVGSITTVSTDEMRTGWLSPDAQFRSGTGISAVINDRVYASKDEELTVIASAHAESQGPVIILCSNHKNSQENVGGYPVLFLDTRNIHKHLSGRSSGRWGERVWKALLDGDRLGIHPHVEHIPLPTDAEVVKLCLMLVAVYNCSWRKVCRPTNTALFTSLMDRHMVLNKMRLYNNPEMKEATIINQLGGIVGDIVPGIHGPAATIDYSSFYPRCASIPNPETRLEVGNTPGILQSVYTALLDTRQQSSGTLNKAAKYAANSGYGLVNSTAAFPYRCRAVGAAILTRGRELITKLKTELKLSGFVIIQSIVDSVTVTHPQYPDVDLLRTAVVDFCVSFDHQLIESYTPSTSGVKFPPSVGLPTVYDKIMVIKKNHYAAMTASDPPKFKVRGIVSMLAPPVVNKVTTNAIVHILREQTYSIELGIHQERDLSQFYRGTSGKDCHWKSGLDGSGLSRNDIDDDVYIQMCHTLIKYSSSSSSTSSSSSSSSSVNRSSRGVKRARDNDDDAGYEMDSDVVKFLEFLHSGDVDGGCSKHKMSFTIGNWH